jgi:dipeptidyl aminopeptidase B
MLIELNNWLINAFNGEWLRTADAVPSEANIMKREIGV